CCGGVDFFFQAEDGIRDPLVTGVQTCALPICRVALRCRSGDGRGSPLHHALHPMRGARTCGPSRGRSTCPGTFCQRPEGQRNRRSEERRVGKGGRKEEERKHTVRGETK